ncbi:uncharacterized protein LY79DRAFT_658873 [Colletotrichum navitas]|uniref:Fe2OG dioxygenase domain-containing protein n=1 Tax=Colletotrichum navitas TaxID=681940 RepID=A0AAD8Q1D9_9PEZI|nr:uncharacterized protein LY79DRAFT_658873 [Colletotrichum navitas]KAK1593710.1 hypothetical protein LY79DRAFT_658873 [Colletotrichum navitas]
MSSPSPLHPINFSPAMMNSLSEETAPVEAQPQEVERLFASVRAVLASGSDNAIFTIGGTVKGLASDSEDAAAPQVTVRWDSRDQAHGRKAAFPVQKTEEAQVAFARLVDDCQPATFGRNEQEVLDETYRKAGKMDETAFKHGIIDTVLQSLARVDKSSNVNRGVRAELYKLNIYSAPSGKFKPHVDTPRSEQQMGSLVVCLPHPHKGGQLAVRHRDQEVVYDWSADSPARIQWAAFFSDCEHEVREVTEGHRVTLTYNLYWTPYGPTSMADQSVGLEEGSLLFYSSLESFYAVGISFPMLTSATGGRVGFTCTHASPHSSGSGAEGLRHGLKGIDMLLYQALKRLVGANAVLIQTALNLSNSYCYGEEYRENLAEAFVTKPGSPMAYESWEEEEDIRKFGRETVHVTWLNHKPDGSDNRELAITYMAPCLSSFYSSMVIMTNLGSLSDDGGRNEFQGDVESFSDDNDNE